MAASFATAIVIGASSGIGEAMVKKLAAGGTRVAAVARRKAELDRLVEAGGGKVVGYVHDVKDHASASALFERMVAELGGCDLLLYNAGVMPRVTESEYDFDKDREMVEVNLLGAMRWLDLGAVYMEARGSGTLAGISSVAGDRGRRGNPAYHATKAGLTTFLESLRNRLSRKGVNVVTVKPGPTRTAMTEGLKLPLLVDADVAADGALAIIRSGGQGYVPAIWMPIMLIIRHIPSILFRRMSF